MGDGGRNFLQVVADAFLLGASNWGLVATREEPFASTAFCFYALRGFFGILYFLTEDTFTSFYQRTGECCLGFCFPLFAAHVHARILDPWTLGLTHLIVPTVQLFGGDLSKTIRSLSLAYSAGAIVYYDFMKRNIYYSFLIAIPLIQEAICTEEKNDCEDFGHLINCLLAWSLFTGEFPVRINL